MRLTSPASCRSPGASSGIGMSILIGLKRARGLHRSLYRDSDHAHLHLGTHGLTQPKCQKFVEISTRRANDKPELQTPTSELRSRTTAAIVCESFAFKFGLYVLHYRCSGGTLEATRKLA